MPPDAVPPDADRRLRLDVADMLERAWQPHGFCVPNPSVYPHQWLWDSCFHSLVWAELADERAVIELRSVLAHQDEQGFVPHMTYWERPRFHADFWGREGTSSITQPPMFGHATAELVRRGFDVDDETIDRARRGLEHLLDDRTRTPRGLVPVIHPWETGCDDSPRWDAWRSDDGSVEAWRVIKAELVAAIAAGRNDFAVGSIGFNALIAWNAAELVSIGVDLPAVDDLCAAIADSWDADRSTWIDDGPAASSGIRTADALLAILIDPRPEALAQLSDHRAFGCEHGVRGVHAAEPYYHPQVYWRGGVWPQLTYLLARGAAAAGEDGTARRLARGLRSGAQRSGLSEYWHPDTAEALGARPQTWSGLAICT